MLSCISQDRQGAALVEYGLLIGLIAVVCFGATQTLGTTINGVLTTASALLAAV